MAKQNDTQKLLAREARRQSSIVGSIAGIVVPVEAPAAEAEVGQAPAEALASPAKPLVIRPTEREARTARKQIVITPSLDRRVTRKCARERLSLNEVVNQLLQHWVDLDDA